jgi:hypothetical protein
MPVYDTRGTNPIHMDQVLTNISVGWPNGELVGNWLFPPVPVRKQSDKYYVFGRESWGVPITNDLRAPGVPAQEVPGLQVSTDSYFAQEHALKIPVTPEEAENADSPLSPLRDGTELITSQLLLIRELFIKNLVTTAANYSSGMSTTLAGTDQWSDLSGSSTADPVDDVKTGRTAMHAKIFLEPNRMIIPYQVMSKLEDSPKIIERIKYSERGLLTPQIIAAFFGGPQIRVPGVGYNSANPAQTASLGYIWGKDVIMAYVPDRPGMKIPAFGYEFVWRYPSGTDQAVERWWDNDRIATLVRVRRRYDIKLVAVDSSGDSIAGYIIKSAVA